MKLYFITGNENKFREVKSMIPEVNQIDMDLPEIQSLDSKEIIEEKLRTIKNCDGKFFCEDTSLYIKDLNGLPGPLIKWFLKAIGTEGIWKLAENTSKKAVAKTIIGFNDREKNVFFESEMNGKIVKPESNSGYGWDALFKPDCCDKTFAEMGLEIRPMRKEAIIKLKKYLENEN